MQTTFTAERFAPSFDVGTRTLKAIKVGTVANKISPDGEVTSHKFTEEQLMTAAVSWTGGAIRLDHNYPTDGVIESAWYEAPYVMMRISGLNPEIDARVEAGEHSGFSIDGTLEADSVIGTAISILFPPIMPACGASAGCGLTAQMNSEADNMPEDKNMDKEILEAKANATTIATLEAKQLQHEDVVAAKDTQIAALEASVAETTAELETKFTKEQVEASVTSAIEAEKATATLHAEQTAMIAKMFPDGMSDELTASVAEKIAADDFNGAMKVVTDTVDFKTLKAQVVTETAADTIVAEKPAPTMGNYDPYKREWVN
ncbi:MAG: hypothetical protein KAJ03_11185 [Gammaproteobacteria bacterium]|nr:hypothetical protein [Gammaproteobacteria bacterium]